MNPYNKKIGIGTVQFGTDYGITNQKGQTKEAEVTKILDYAIHKGISYIDTASSYGNAESVLGKNQMQRYKVVSKFMPEDTGGPIKRQLVKTIDRLGITCLYGYLAHRPKSLLYNKKEWDLVCGEKAKGKIKKIGFSLNSPEELQRLLEVGLVPDLVQIPFNFFDRRFKQLLIELKEQNCEIHVRSAFLQGLFFMDSEALPDYFAEVRDHTKKLQERYGANLSGSLLKYVVDHDFVDIVIVGVNNLNQLKQNLKGLALADSIEYAPPKISDKILMPYLWP